ncbi:MAG: adenylate/guanylate cyclase domain-containing protein [Rhodobacteraceae bacterium]|nr:adenylate/guanylate cyclase domain-containing protein [Paracoccaceae bacterium]
MAGVIGKTRLGYDLWGGTVNVASRLQGAAAPGTIQISEPVQLELADEYTLRPLGPVMLKGKGEVPTWELFGKR